VSTRYGLVTAVWSYQGLPDFLMHLSVLMASLSTSGHSAADTLPISSEDSHNSQDTNSSQTSDDLEEDVTLIELDEALEIMPELVDMDVRLFDEDEDGSESEDGSDESNESDNDSGNDADDEEALVDEVLESYCGPSGCANILRTCTQLDMRNLVTSLSLIVKSPIPFRPN
jgi:hypothetical protein